METAQIGGTAKGGISRLTLTDDDRRGARLVQGAMRGAGLHGHGRRGRQHVRAAARQATTTLPPIAMGSHLDTQPTGGKFDGVLGVLGALEALRTLHDLGYETNAPLELVNWTNEEGSRFAPAMLGSGVLPACSRRDYAYAREDRDGNTFAATTRRASAIAATRRAGTAKFGAMFELHIEQGPILEDEGKMIGVVTGVQGMRWYEVTVTGQDAHTGATPMHLRKNALLGAARIIERSTRSRLDACAGRGRHRRPGRGQAEHAQRDPGRGVLHRRFPPSRRSRARRDGERVSRGVAGDLPTPLGLELRREADLELAGRGVRSRSDRLRPRRAPSRPDFPIARHGLGRRP